MYFYALVKTCQYLNLSFSFIHIACIQASTSDIVRNKVQIYCIGFLLQVRLLLRRFCFLIQRYSTLRARDYLGGFCLLILKRDAREKMSVLPSHQTHQGYVDPMIQESYGHLPFDLNSMVDGYSTFVVVLYVSSRVSDHKFLELDYD